MNCPTHEVPLRTITRRNGERMRTEEVCQECENARHRDRRRERLTRAFKAFATQPRLSV